MKNYKLSEEFRNALFEYLGSRPFVEVHKLITGLAQIPLVNESKNEPVVPSAPEIEKKNDAKNK